jgi:predicted secreted protein
MMGKTAVTFAIACLPLAALTLIPRVTDAQSMSQSAPPSGVLSLSADQSIDVPEDVVRITLFHEQEGSDPASLTKALKERAAEALSQARGDSKVTVQTGAFTVYPSTDRDGKISAWRGRTEAILESTDFAAASKLAGKLAGTMQVANVAFSLSPEARRDAEQKLTARAIATFRQQAQTATQAFGYANYSIREVRINRRGAILPRPVTMRAMAADTPNTAPVPIEGGKSTVTIDVAGSVQMSR